MTLLNSAPAVYLGELAVDAVYAGNVKVWPETAPMLTYEQLVLSHNPVAYWPLTDLSDVSGGGRHLTTSTPAGQVSDAVSLVSDGPATGAKRFTGLQTLGLSRADDAGLSPTAAMTLETWFKPTIVYSHSFLGKSQTRMIFRGNGRVAWQIQTDQGPTWVDSTAILEVGNAYHIVGNFQAGDFKLYLNGVLEASADWGNAIVDEPVPFTIGGNGVDTGTNGTLDEVALYDYALSAEHILAHYQSGIGV